MIKGTIKELCGIREYVPHPVLSENREDTRTRMQEAMDNYNAAREGMHISDLAEAVAQDNIQRQASPTITTTVSANTSDITVNTATRSFQYAWYPINS